MNTQNQTDLLTPEQVAVRLSVSAKTVKNWRGKGTGPKSIRLSHTRVRYRQSDVEAWLKTQERKE